MEIIFTSLLPIFLLIALGYFFNVKNFPKEDFWESADKLTYFVLMPSLLIYKLSKADIHSIESTTLLSTGFIGVTILFLLLLIINKKFEGRSFTSIVQGSIRYNTYVFLAIVDSLYGDSGVVLGAIFITFMIPLLNIYSILSFAIFVNNSKLSLKSVLIPIIKNPLILACVFGGLLSFLKISFPLPIENTLKILSQTALPLGLISIGVALVMKDLKLRINELIFANFTKLIVMPVIFFIIGNFMGLDEVYLGIVLIFAAVPTAPTSFILARQLGGDERLMSAIITSQTLISAFTLSIILNLLI